jgi:dTDP-4-amino-4,6-dideoxygalactose transaminase
MRKNGRDSFVYERHNECKGRVIMCAKSRLSDLTTHASDLELVPEFKNALALGRMPFAEMMLNRKKLETVLKTAAKKGEARRRAPGAGYSRANNRVAAKQRMADKVPYLDLAAQIRGIRKEIDAAIARTLDNCSFCLGPDVVQFEKDFAKFCEAEHCLGFNSGTSALHAAMRILDIGPGDEVITTPFTFVATSWAISYVGAKPVYVDIDDATFNIDPRQIELAITPKTKAILPVHLYGQPFDVDNVLEICRKHRLPMVEDACQAHGARYKGKVVGTFGDMSCFSFYPGKNLGACGEGGALVTNNDKFATRARSLREHGSTVRYYHDEIGYNYRMEGFQGAVLGVKLKYLAKWTKERQRVAARYTELLADTPLQLPVAPDYDESAWHLYVVRHPRRDELKKHLEDNGIGCAVHYPIPVHLHKAYAHLGHRAGKFPVAEMAAHKCLSLPIYPELTDAQVRRVVEVIKGFVF